MRTRELIRAISNDTGISHSDCEAVLHSLAQHFETHLLSNGNFKLPRIGSFAVTQHQCRKYDFKHSTTMEKMVVKIRFKPTGELERATKILAAISTED